MKLNRLLLVATASCVAMATSGASLAQPRIAHNIGQNAKKWDGSPGVPIHPDQSVELGLKIKQPFKVVALGDLLQFQPFANSNDPDVRYLIDIAKAADVTVGDLENEMYDFDNFGHAGGNLGTKEVADDWARMGIDMVSRANNKNQRAPGVWEDFRQVERVGIIHMGVAKTLPEARMARYFSTPKGLVGEVGISADGGTDACCTGGAPVYVSAAQLDQVRKMKDSIIARRDEVDVPIDMPKPDPAGEVSLFGLTFKSGAKPASEPQPERRGRGGPGGGEGQPGVDGVKNALNLTLFHGVTAEQMAQLRAIAGDRGSGPDLHAFGTQFRVMDRPGEHSFDMNDNDRKEILTQIRTGKQASDLMISNIHWHQNRYDFQHYSYDHFPADFEIEFAHQAIDQGDDVFVAQGVHTIKGVEIYKGKPIFYGLSNFIFQSAIMPKGKGKLPDVAGRPTQADNFFPGEGGGVAAPADPNVIVGEHETQGFWQLKPNLEALMAESVFDGGKLKEVRIYPVDLGQTTRPGSQVGIPRRPTPEVAKKILDELVEYSKPFGTKFDIKDGVAVVHVS